MINVKARYTLQHEISSQLGCPGQVYVLQVPENHSWRIVAGEKPLCNSPISPSMVVTA